MSKSGPTKPARTEVIAANVPERIRRLKRWVIWRWKRRRKKWDKPPLQLDGSFARVDDPETWITFEEALAAHLSGDFDGIGFVLGYVPEEDVNYTGLDLDDCRDPGTGEISDWATAHLNSLDTYSEYSPSGLGVKALAIGKLPGPDRNESERMGVEMYSGGRYFTITGQISPGAKTDIADRTAQLADLYYEIFGESAPKKSAFTTAQSSDRELALSALAGLNPTLAVGYFDWLRVGMALHSVGTDQQMLEAWDTWSRQGADKYDPEACARKWQSFGKKGGLGLGSLIYWARENGWKVPREGHKPDSSAKADASILDRLDDVLEKGAEVFFRDRALLEALARLAETDPAEFACVRAKVQKARISLRDLDSALSPFRQAFRAKQPRPDSAGEYRIAGGRIIHNRNTRNGPTDVPLCNFSARIAEVVTRDDGVEQTALFSVDGNHQDGRPLPRLRVPATEFQRLDWVTTGWHGEAVVYAGSGMKDHTRCAIELLSRDRFRRVQFTHTGWRQIDDRWVFLHAGGAIGGDGLVGGLEVVLDGALGLVSLPAPPSGGELVRAVGASLDLLYLAPNRLCYPVVGAVYRAPWVT